MKGILLINTGSPKSPHRKDVRAFIEDMLSDPLVMTVKDWIRPILVKGIIGPVRQFASAKHYDMIWDKEHSASPIMYRMNELATKLAEQTGLPVEIAMRYQIPSIPEALDKMQKENPTLHEVIVLPLFPQYAESSYQTVVNELGNCFFKKPYSFRLKVVEPYFAHPEYISSLAKSLKPYLGGGYDRLIFNFHSLPVSHVDKGWKKGKEFDYVYQIKETIRLLLKELNIDANKTRLAYSSAIGSNWLEPDLCDMLEEQAKAGDKKILVVSPGFAVDNLETLYDLDILAKEHFLDKGGEEFIYIPCLNSEPYWVDGVIKMIY